MKTDIAIVTPTAAEYLQMLKHISGRTPVAEMPLPTETGNIGGHSVLCAASGKGEAETASAVTLILERAKPNWLFLVGIAGGFPAEKVRRGDVIVAHTVHSFDYGKLTDGKFKRRPELDFNCDRTLLSWAEIVQSDPGQGWRTLIQAPRPSGTGLPQAHVDCYVASSDKVVDDPSHTFYDTVAKSFPEIHAVEMEGIGAGASVRLSRDTGFLMIRGISDEPGSKLAGGSSERQLWKAYAAEAAAAFTRTVIERLPVNSMHGGTSSALLSADLPVLDGVPIKFAEVANALKLGTPNYYTIFTKACEAARTADAAIDRAEAAAKKIRLLLAPTISKAKRPVHGRKRLFTVHPAVAGDLGECGIRYWDSGDEYAGQFSNGVETGLGVCNIYATTRDYNPNDMAFYRGEFDADRFGPHGGYTFVDGAEFRGEWVDGRPKFGVKVFVHRDDPDFYFGGFGTFDKNRWLPNGHGIAVYLQKRQIVCAIFRAGDPDERYTSILPLVP
jgi:nucleoside phosphorylase